MDDKDKFIIKLALMGDTGTGKTIFRDYLKGGLEELDFQHYMATNGATYMQKKLLFKKNIFSLDIWDFSGRNIYERIGKFFYSNAQIIFMFYEQKNRETFETAKRRLKSVKENCLYDVILVLIANKYDLNLYSKKNDDIITDEEALEFADENNILYSHLSILEKYSNGINELFEKVIKEYIKVKNIEI